MLLFSREALRKLQRKHCVVRAWKMRARGVDEVEKLVEYGRSYRARLSARGLLLVESFDGWIGGGGFLAGR